MHAWQGIVSNGGTNVIANNTVLYSTDQGFRVFTGGGTPTITNNIAAYCGVGIAAIGTITKTTNCYFSNTTNFLSLGSGGSIEGSAVTQDPRVQSDGGIPASSPCATAGTYVSGVTLANGRLRPNFVPIGAYMAVLPRTARV
jgi:parallel beta-helix repeat protein